jgi:plastocyanin
MRKLALTAAVAAFASIALVACGGGSSSSSTAASTTSTTTSAAGGGGAAGGAKSTLNVEADPGGALKYTQSSLSTKAGQVTVDFNNPSPLAHNVTIEDSSGQQLGATDTINGGSKTSTTVSLKPGTYKFLCTVDGHAAAGMEGTLTVK